MSDGQVVAARERLDSAGVGATPAALATGVPAGQVGCGRCLGRGHLGPAAHERSADMVSEAIKGGDRGGGSVVD